MIDVWSSTAGKEGLVTHASHRLQPWLASPGVAPHVHALTTFSRNLGQVPRATLININMYQSILFLTSIKDVSPSEGPKLVYYGGILLLVIPLDDISRLLSYRKTGCLNIPPRHQREHTGINNPHICGPIYLQLRINNPAILPRQHCT